MSEAPRCHQEKIFFSQFCGSVLLMAWPLCVLLLTILPLLSPLFPCSELSWLYMHSLTAPHSWCLPSLLKNVRVEQSCLV